MILFRRKKRIVCIGGGSGMPRAVLSELKKTPHYLTVISAVLDSGGSAGKLRQDYQTIAFGDIRRAFIELVNWPLDIKDYLSFRFQGGCLDNHVLANIMLSALYLSGKKYQMFFEKINKLLPDRQCILPATVSNSHLHAILENGEEIKGEENIDVPKHDSNLRIKKIFLAPEANPCPITLKKIAEADAIIIGPGDLYTSLLQTLLINGLGEAIIKSPAKKILICNLMTKRGESNNFNVQDFSNEIERYLGGELDYVIYNSAEPSKKRLSQYLKERSELLSMVEVPLGLDNKKFIGADLLELRGPIVHNPIVLNKIILKLI